MAKIPLLLNYSGFPPEILSKQNKVIKHSWKYFKNNGVYYLADQVGSGKSYISLSLAISDWLEKRKTHPNKTYRLVVICPSRDLLHSWESKLLGSSSLKDFFGLASTPGNHSFFDHYIDDYGKVNSPKVVVYNFSRKRDSQLFSNQFSKLDDKDANKELAFDKKSSRNSRLEILLTTPGYLSNIENHTKDYDQSGLVYNWLIEADTVIADEIFSAKREATVYGRILRSINKKYGALAGKPKKLIGLSATFMSRDLHDCHGLLELGFSVSKSRNNKGFFSDTSFDDHSDSNLKRKFAAFQKALLDGISALDVHRNYFQKQYNEMRKELSSTLPEIVVRGEEQRLRNYKVWGFAGNKMSEIEDLGSFPVEDEKFDVLYEKLYDQLSWDEVVDTKFYSDYVSRKIKTKKNLSESKFYHAETSVCENNGNPRHVKIEALRNLIETIYTSREKEWLSGNKNFFRYKILIYVKHINTAKYIGGRDHKELLNNHLLNLMNNTVAKLIKMDELSFIWFDKGDRINVSKDVLEKIRSHFYGESDPFTRIKNNTTLFLGALLNAFHSRKKSAAFLSTIFKYGLRQEKIEPYLELVTNSLDIRLHLVGHDKILNSYGSKVRNEISLVALDLHQYFRGRRRDEFIDELNELAEPILKKYFRGTRRTISVDEDENVIEFVNRFEELLKGHQKELKEIISNPSEWGSRYSKVRKNQPVVRHLTGESDPYAREHVFDDFLSLRSPFVLVMTNIGQVGIDLHKFCWDIIHYTPDWTHHTFEQKTGRIDRPRSIDELKSYFNIGDTKKASHITVHFLIWPLTYDEKILSRLNLRSRLATRLLSSKNVNKESRKGEDTNRNLSDFLPLDLTPRE